MLDILDSLGKASWFCSMDCCKGFFQLCCTKESAKYAAINTPWGTYEPRRMMQGLRGIAHLLGKGACKLGWLSILGLGVLLI
jgi:hypothetical protein